jgi:Ca2+-binding EF-hand superfamily protein
VKIKRLLIPIIFLTFSACNEEDKNSMMNMPQFQLWEEDFNGADLNGDGILDAGEIQGKIARSFANEDTDHDEVLTAFDHEGPEYQSGELVDFLNAPPIADEARGEIEFDSDGDGIITFEEYSDFHNEKFIHPIDSDKDGKIELLEVFRFYDPNSF